MPTALLLENIHPYAVERLEAAGFAVKTAPKALSEDELLAELEGVNLLGIRSKTKVTPKVLEANSSLEAIGCFCIGTDQVALTDAAINGVAVFNAPYSNTRSVVELALGEIIMLSRDIPDKSTSLHQGVWNKSATGSHEVRGKTLGIVGYGNIGVQLSILAEALGMRVVFYDLVDKLSLGNAERCVSLDELLEVSDIVSLHVDGRPSNAKLFGAEQFAKMKPGALFLNLCRGFVIDHDALRQHLESGHIAGAALDVFATEPAGKGAGFESPLRGAPNTILTPHIGGSTEEAQADIGHFVAKKLLNYWRSGDTTLSVNLPALTPPPLTPGRRRFSHLHRNVPGVMARINSILGQRGVNVDAQLLGTRGEVGYVLADISDRTETEAIDALAGIDATIRLRAL